MAGACKIRSRGNRHFGTLSRAEVIDALVSMHPAWRIATAAGLQVSSWRNVRRLGLRRIIVGDVIIIEAKGL